MSLLFLEAPKELKVCLLSIVVLGGLLWVEVLMLREELALASRSGPDFEDIKVWIHVFVTWMRVLIFFSLWRFQLSRHRRCGSILAGVLHSSDFHLPNLTSSHPLQISKLSHYVFLPTRNIVKWDHTVGRAFHLGCFSRHSRVSTGPHRDWMSSHLLTS